MPTIQPQSPKAQREMLRNGSRGMVLAEKGQISRAAPAVQAELKRQQREFRKQTIFRGFCMAGGGLILLVATMFFFDHTAQASKQALTGGNKAAAVGQPALVYVETPQTLDPRDTLEYATTPQEFLNNAKVNGVRLGGRSTKAIINGAVYRVGDVVAPEMGLVFVGHDPDGEYLLFRDAERRTVFLRVYQEGEAS